MDSEENTLSFMCPHCQQGFHDDFECLEANAFLELACESCRKTFTLMIAECLHCGEETVLGWREPPPSRVRALLVCKHCTQPLLRIEEPSIDL